jgi:hypothetical protein
VIPPQANAEFVCAMEDVREVYARPDDPARPVVCLDELSKQPVAETRVPLPVEPGQPERVDYEYERCGTANLFLSGEPGSGTATSPGPNGAPPSISPARCATCKPAALYEAFEPAVARAPIERLEMHHTPQHGSGLNMAEIEPSVLSRQCLDRRMPDLETLTREVAAWERSRNADPRLVNWRFTTPDARLKLKRLYPSIQDG